MHVKFVNCFYLVCKLSPRYLAKYKQLSAYVTFSVVQRLNEKKNVIYM